MDGSSVTASKANHSVFSDLAAVTCTSPWSTEESCWNGSSTRFCEYASLTPATPV